MHATRIELLQQMPIFGGIREELLQRLLGETRSVTVRAGDFFFRETDPASCMYVLEAGRAVVLKSWRGNEYRLHHLKQGDCFGEMALMDLLPRSASVRAEIDCAALELAPAGLYALFERDAEQFALLQMNLGRELSRRLRATDELLFRLTMRDDAGLTEPHDMLRTI